MYESYLNLCRASLHPQQPQPSLEDTGDDGLYCFVDLANFNKVEVLHHRPLVVLFHQLLSPEAASRLRKAAKPHLEAPRTVSSKSGKISSVSSKRSGKVAFLTQDELGLQVSCKVIFIMPNARFAL